MSVPAHLSRITLAALVVVFFADPAAGADVQKADVKSVTDPQTGKLQAPPQIENAQGVKKVEGLDTVTAVKPPEQKPVTPPPPPPPPPPPAGSATKVESAPTAAAAAIRPVKGVTGIEAMKRQNLEAALQMKAASAGTPAGTGAEKGGKGKAAAAALLSGNAEMPAPKPGPKDDGRNKLQDPKKLLESGS